MISDRRAPFHLAIADLRWPEKVAAAVLLISLLVVVGGNIQALFNASEFHEELRILYHFDPGRTNSKDYTGQFLGEFPQPFLYSFLTGAALSAGMDLITFHKVVALVCSALLLAGVAASGWRIGGAMLAVVTTLLVAAQPVYHYQIASATPHAFAFPLLIWGLVSLLNDRPYWLAALTILSALLYVPAAPVMGMALAWHILITRKGLSGQNPDRIAHVFVLGLTAAISFALLWHQVTPIDGYGATLRPGEQIDIYPENGRAGRYFDGVFNPAGYVGDIAIGQFNAALPVLLLIAIPMVIAAIAGLGLNYLRAQPKLFRTLLGFVVPSLVLCILIMQLAPYVAYRFLLYPLFTVLPLLFVFGLFTLVYGKRSDSGYAAAVILVIVAPLILALSGRNAYSSAPMLELDEPSSALMNYLQRLPTDSLVAAWPGGRETSLIPYVAGRPLLVNYKAHYPTYEGHVINMRERMFDLIDAYLARDIQPLIDLHCRWQADFLVVDRSHFPGQDVSLKYFEPFDSRVEEILRIADKAEMILREPPADVVAFRAGRFTVVDLGMLAERNNCTR